MAPDAVAALRQFAQLPPAHKTSPLADPACGDKVKSNAVPILQHLESLLIDRFVPIVETDHWISAGLFELSHDVYVLPELSAGYRIHVTGGLRSHFVIGEQHRLLSRILTGTCFEQSPNQIIE